MSSHREVNGFFQITFFFSFSRRSLGFAKKTQEGSAFIVRVRWT